MFPLISALSQSAGVILDKIILTRRRVEHHVYVPILFLFLFVITACVYPFLGKISPEFFTTHNLIYFALLIIVALIWNYFYYRAIGEEKVQQFELILLFQPLLTILLATIIFKSERNLHIEIAAIIAAIALIVAHAKKDHFVPSRGSIDTIMAVVFMSIELIIIEILLTTITPVALYAIRTGVIAIAFYFLYRPRISQVAIKNFGLIFLTSILGAGQMITKFYGFEKYGVIYTSLILIIAPLLIYICSVIVLHEKLKLRTAISALVILLCIIYATVIGK